EEQRPPRIAPRAEGADLNLERALALREEELVRAAMEQSRGNQARAAELLGVTPRSVYNKLRKMKRA
ncbi:helix-turn-helix domain-containing protein, partial [Nostoc sp. NIES-2111]